MDAAMVAIHTRAAASKVGATTMDRPEWVAVNPVAIEAYVALTNNSNRGVKPNAGGDLTPVGGPNPRAETEYGQIVRWYPDGEDHVSEAPGSQSKSQSPAQCSQKRDGEDCPHGDHTKGGERRRRCEEKRVNHVGRTGDPKAPDVDHHRHDQRASDPVMNTPPAIGRQARQVSAR